MNKGKLSLLYPSTNPFKGKVIVLRKAYLPPSHIPQIRRIGGGLQGWGDRDFSIVCITPVAQGRGGR